MEFTQQTEKQGDLEPIHFSTWKEVLVKEPLSSFQRDLFCEAIVRFLRYCKEVRAPASVALIRIYLREKGSNVDRAALRWFYRAHRREPNKLRSRRAAAVEHRIRPRGSLRCEAPRRPWPRAIRAELIGSEI